MAALAACNVWRTGGDLVLIVLHFILYDKIHSSFLAHTGPIFLLIICSLSNGSALEP